MELKKCVVCDGKGLISRPQWVAGDVNQWASNSCGPWTCNACNGTGFKIIFNEKELEKGAR